MASPKYVKLLVMIEVAHCTLQCELLELCFCLQSFPQKSRRRKEQQSKQHFKVLFKL
jgi:hypothetical protein